LSLPCADAGVVLVAWMPETRLIDVTRVSLFYHTEYIAVILLLRCFGVLRRARNTTAATRGEEESAESAPPDSFSPLVSKRQDASRPKVPTPSMIASASRPSQPVCCRCRAAATFAGALSVRSSPAAGVPLELVFSCTKRHYTTLDAAGLFATCACT